MQTLVNALKPACLCLIVSLGALTGCVDGPAEPVELSLLSFNLRHNADCWEERMELIADGIASLRPDVIGLQEIEIAAEQGEILDEMLVARGLDYELRQLSKSGLAAELTGEGIGVMSLYPVRDVERLDLSDGRVSLLATIDVDGSSLLFVDTHLDSGGDDAVRTQQAADTLAAMDAGRAAADRTAFVGDFNSDPDDDAISLVTEAGLVDAWADAHGDADGFTSGIELRKDGAEQSADRRIDYVFVEGAEVLSAEVVLDDPRDDGLYPSDHLGVLARVR
jgi:endonuclease/exonuclease/phosphatase family metal-dependent hydrolase